MERGKHITHILITPDKESLSRGASWIELLIEYVLTKARSQNRDIRAVITADDRNINRELVNRGYGAFRSDLGGAEQQAMHGRMGRLFGKYTEELFFEGDQSAANPMRYIPTPFHTKFAQERTALSQYTQQEAVVTRMRRWERPIHDFLAPYLRGAVARVTGEDAIPKEVQHRRDLDTLADMLKRPGPSRLPARLPPLRSAPAKPAGRPANPVSSLHFLAPPAGLCSSPDFKTNGALFHLSARLSRTALSTGVRDSLPCC
jgi:hypothetical protein